MDLAREPARPRVLVDFRGTLKPFFATAGRYVAPWRTQRIKCGARSLTADIRPFYFFYEGSLHAAYFFATQENGTMSRVLFLASRGQRKLVESLNFSFSVRCKGQCVLTTRQRVSAFNTLYWHFELTHVCVLYPHTSSLNITSSTGLFNIKSRHLKLKFL